MRRSHKYLTYGFLLGTLVFNIYLLLQFHVEKEPVLHYESQENQFLILDWTAKYHIFREDEIIQCKFSRMDCERYRFRSRWFLSYHSQVLSIKIRFDREWISSFIFHSALFSFANTCNPLDGWPIVSETSRPSFLSFYSHAMEKIAQTNPKRSQAAVFHCVCSGKRSTFI